MPRPLYRLPAGPLLSKDHTRKLAVLLLAFLAFVYCYFSFLLGPVNQQQAAALTRLAELQLKLANSGSDLQKATRLGSEAAASVRRYSAISALIPSGASVAWFPPRLKVLFMQEGLDQASVRFAHTTILKQPELAKYVRTQWSVEVAGAGYETMGRAVARIENEEPLLIFNSLKITADPGEPEFQRASLGVALITRETE